MGSKRKRKLKHDGSFPGWTGRMAGLDVPALLVSPEGIEYKIASGKERTDLLLRTRHGELRLREYKSSAEARRKRAAERKLSKRKKEKKRHAGLSRQNR